MAITGTTHLSEVLGRTGLFDAAELGTILGTIRQGSAGVVSTLVEGGFAPEEKLLRELARVLGMPYLQLARMEIEQGILDKLPTKVVFQYQAIPVSFQDGALLVAVNDPFNPSLQDALRLAAGARIRLGLSTADDLARATKQFYGVGAETVDRMIRDDRYDVAPDQAAAKADLGDLDQETSIVKFVNQIIWEAYQQGATDIHLEPMEERLRVRYRIDGVLHQTPVPAQLNRFQAAIISRIKVMAGIDIAEKRLPMDGRIGLRVKNEDLDIRVSTMPTVYGESVSLRLLQRKGSLVTITELGFGRRDRERIEKIINRPNGIVLVTGPTGSGKSTSLYAFLNEINTVDQRILTVEDPIEYEMAGINQVLVRPDIGLTFARTLRSFLRQDPDIIMVGEIRDAETAEIAIQAALTGHLVFSTLHTNDSAGAFTRLIDMGVEPFLVASAVTAVVAQRLVRRLCPGCRRAVPSPDRLILERIGFPVGEIAARAIYEAAGCDACSGTGYKGRCGIFELLAVTESIESLVIARRSTHEIREKALEEGLTTLRADGWQKVLEGITTTDEVMRVSEDIT